VPLSSFDFPANAALAKTVISLTTLGSLLSEDPHAQKPLPSCPANRLIPKGTGSPTVTTQKQVFVVEPVSHHVA
jgi:hypothetical protein